MTAIVTTEEAAALMIGLDYIPPGISLRGMTAAFLEEAEVELHNAKLDKVDWRRKSFLEQRVLACQHRHELVGIYLEALELELGKGEQSILVPISEGSVSSRIDLDKLAYWASNLFGISLPSKQATGDSPAAPTDISAPQLSKSMASLYTTFSLLLDAFTELAPTKFKINGNPNESQIAEHLESIGKKFYCEGQGRQSIRKRIRDIYQYHPATLLKK